MSGSGKPQVAGEVCCAAEAQGAQATYLINWLLVLLARFFLCAMHLASASLSTHMQFNTRQLLAPSLFLSFLIIIILCLIKCLLKSFLSYLLDSLQIELVHLLAKLIPIKHGLTP